MEQNYVLCKIHRRQITQAEGNLISSGSVIKCKVWLSKLSSECGTHILRIFVRRNWRIVTLFNLLAQRVQVHFVAIKRWLKCCHLPQSTCTTDVWYEQNIFAATFSTASKQVLGCSKTCLNLPFAITIMNICELPHFISPSDLHNTPGWANKTGLFLKVYNSCIWWCRKAFNTSNVQLFIRRETDILNVTIYKYSLHKIRETILCRKYHWQWLNISGVLQYIKLYHKQQILHIKHVTTITSNVTLCDKSGKNALKTIFSGQPAITGKMVMKKNFIHFHNYQKIQIKYMGHFARWCVLSASITVYLSQVCSPGHHLWQVQCAHLI